MSDIAGVLLRWALDVRQVRDGMHCAPASVVFGQTGGPPPSGPGFWRS